ncbi:hypothetical protein C4D60_Mb03t13070 [Musa balbisiana]|uniref:Uncharacterized protein n=1 Tax=Musa balbisiana TaxID=52838 RepID=A0A4S8JAN9_MUSBA|nr:hypothetical protein C4D60_Mb03t13070 [Musa balbisiana]
MAFTPLGLGNGHMISFPMGKAVTPAAPYHRGVPPSLGKIVVPGVAKPLALSGGLYWGVSGGWDRAIQDPLPGLLRPV